MKRLELRWALYDWANSVYSLLITSSLFPVYWDLVTPDYVYGIRKSALYSLTLTAAFLVIALIAPPLGAIADLRGWRKQFMTLFLIMGSIACSLLYFYTGSDPLFGTTMFFFATVGFAGSLVFYNAYLPDITTPQRFESVSALGYSLGYIGSVLLAIVSLFIIMNPEKLGLADSLEGFRVSFLLTGLWWIGFGLFSVNGLPKQMFSRSKKLRWLVMASFQRLKNTMLRISGISQLRLFIIVFFLFSAGVQTVMYLASLFGANELNIASEKLIITILVLQLIAIIGAHGMAYLSRKLGNMTILQYAGIGWLMICLMAFLITTEWEFYVVAGLVGILMGGTQSLLRATYAQFIHQYKGRYTVYFGFYETTEKVAIVLGTLLFALLDQMMESMRWGALITGFWFVLAVVIAYSGLKKRVFR
ncbi:MAG: MFS transporter [Chlorobi bacterium]|nr:MFS transporter [Chlorobiota bacterium]